MKFNYTSFAIIGLLAACASPPNHITPKQTTAPQIQFNKTAKQQSKQNIPSEYQYIIQQAHQQTTGLTQAVLKQTHAMVNQGEIIKGGCWDYLDAAWTRAGVPRQARKVIYEDKIDGNYANPEWLRAGDWIYYVNHSYHGIEHSGMFIGWVDQTRHLALTLSYAGEHRKEPARYKIYDLSGVYKITRAE